MPLPKDPKKAEETRRKMSESAKRKFAHPEVKQALDEKRIQGMQTPEAKARMSESQKKRFADVDARKATSEATKQGMAKPEIRENLSQKQLKRYQEHPEQLVQKSEHMKKLYAETDLRERVSKATKEAMIKVNARLEFQENLRKAMVEVYARPEWRAKLRDARKAMWQTPEYQEVWAKAMSEVHRYRGQTKLEIIVAAVLGDLEIEYEREKRIGRYSIDFYVPGKNLVIECDGEYWHSKPKAQEKDARRDAYLVSHGYTIIRLPEADIKSGNFTVLLNTLLE